MSSNDSYNNGSGTDDSAAEGSSLATPIMDDAVNANMDYWAEWSARRQERRRQYQIDHGESADRHAAATGKHGNHSALWPKFRGGKTTARQAPTAPAEPLSPNQPRPNVATGVTHLTREQKAEFWTEWAARASSAEPIPSGQAPATPRNGDAAPPAERPRPPAVPEPSAARKPETAAAPKPATEAASEPAPRAARKRASAASAEAPALKPAPVRNPEPEPAQRPEPVREIEPFVVVVNDDAPEAHEDGGQAHVSHRSSRRSMRSTSRKRKVMSLLRTRKRFLLMSFILFVAGIGIGGWATYHIKYRADRTVLTVNGKPISEAEYVRRLEIDGGIPELQRLITEEQVLQFAYKSGTYPTAQQVSDRIAEMRKRPDFDQFLKDKRLTPAELDRVVRVDLASDALTTRGVQVTEQEMRKFYTLNISKTNPRAAFYTPEIATISMIVTRDRARALQARRELDKGTAFPAVARQYSVDVSASQGGVLPPVPRGRTRLGALPGMDKAIFRLNPGAIVGPLPLSNIWCIIMRTSKTPASTKPYEEVREDCRKAVMMSKGIRDNNAKLREDFQDFQKKSSLIVMRSP